MFVPAVVRAFRGYRRGDFIADLGAGVTVGVIALPLAMAFAINSGPGLTPESFDRLFHAFHTTKPDGMGMGLSICRSIIEGHGGRIWATTNAPRGAIFQFTLPARRESTS